MVLTTVGTLDVHSVDDCVVTNRGDCCAFVSRQRSTADGPNHFRYWLSNEVDIQVENKSSLDADVVEWCLDFGCN